MTHSAPPPPAEQLSDRAISLIRTSVPALWGAIVAQLLAWLAGIIPIDLAHALADALTTPAAITFAVTVATVVWYWVWRWLEPRVPDWLISLVLGYAKAPTYAPITPDGAAVITSLPDADRRQLVMLRDFLDEGDPARESLDAVLRT